MRPDINIFCVLHCNTHLTQATQLLTGTLDRVIGKCRERIVNSKRIPTGRERWFSEFIPKHPHTLTFSPEKHTHIVMLVCWKTMSDTR